MTHLLNNDQNSDNAPFLLFDQNYLEKWELQEIEKGLYIRKVQYKVEEEQIETLFPFSGILDVLGRLIEMYPEEILFFDLETTGYYLNSSNLPFLMGFGYYKNSYFFLEQVLLLDITKEIHQLEYSGKIIKNFKYIATYNGKKFDIPILKSRFYYHFLKFEEKFHHFDLYYFWKRLLPREFEGGYSQKNLETKLLRIKRENDIDGSMVPQIYYDWRKYNQIDHFHKILLHNEWDIYHLFFLFLKALKVVKNQDKVESKIELGKLFYRNGFYMDAINLLKGFSSSDINEQLEVFKILYRSHLKLQHWEKSIYYLKKRLELNDNPEEMLILIRILQHKIKNYSEAIQYIDKLLEMVKNVSKKKEKNQYLNIQSLLKRKQKLLRWINI